MLTAEETRAESPDVADSEPATAKKAPAPAPAPAPASEAMEEDEIPAEVAPAPASDAAPAAVENEDMGNYEELLRQYYARFFPYREFHQWLSYGDSSDGAKVYANRELSFTLKGDIYLRFLSFNTPAEFKAMLQERQPHKIDIGAVYNCKPIQHKTYKPGQFKPVERELVFDIDMTDYDDIRTCCSEANICSKCWMFMTVAIKIVDRALEEDFGFDHRFWVYSGRRGVHCWVADKAARALDNTARSALIDYLTLVKGGDQQAKKVNLTSPLHPSVRRALDIAEKYFVDLVLDKQRLLASEKHIHAMLALVPDQEVRDELLRRWTEDGLESEERAISRARWSQLEKALAKARKEKKGKAASDLANVRSEIILQYTYPRLDVNVTKGINHLLKSPFCVHPKTGRVCVAIDAKNADKFDPFKVPTISQLLREYEQAQASGAMDVDDDSNQDEADAATVRKSRESDYKKTSLKGYMDTFRVFLKGIDAENKAALRRERIEKNKAEALAGQY